jgi:hypothetical protein
MKAILYVVSVLAACGAAFFSFSLSSKFQAIQSDRLETIATNKKITAAADAADIEIKREKDLLAASVEKRELLTQSVSSLKSTASGLTSDIAKLDEDQKAQNEEFGQLNKALVEVNTILAALGGGVTLDTLPEKIQQIEDDKKAKQKKLEELMTLTDGAEKKLASGRAEVDRLSKRMVERSSRIGLNATEAVVTGVNQDWGFLVIGAGLNSGFTPQTGLLVERDGRVIAQVRPSSVEPTQTVAEISSQSLSSGVRLQAGDRVILSTPSTN